MKSTPFFALACLLALAAPAFAYDGMNTGDSRTAGRSVDGINVYPTWLTDTPEHYEFLPLVSNHDPHAQHSMQWQGQEWDPAAWNANWTPDIAVRKFYDAGIFTRQYKRQTRDAKKGLLVVNLGPTFYKLSELDQQRTLKLLTDREDVFANGYEAVELRDWHTNDVMGSYTAKGLQLY